MHKKLYAANNRGEAFVSVIGATKNEIIKKIDSLGGGLEQPRYNLIDGMMYLTGADENVLYQFDPVKDVLVAKEDELASVPESSLN